MDVLDPSEILRLRNDARKAYLYTLSSSVYELMTQNKGLQKKLTYWQDKSGFGPSTTSKQNNKEISEINLVAGKLYDRILDDATRKLYNQKDTPLYWQHETNRVMKAFDEHVKNIKQEIARIETAVSHRPADTEPPPKRSKFEHLNFPAQSI